MISSLSNSATPRYYGEFREKVLAGIIPVCHEISLEMNRIDNLIANRNYYYDPLAVEGFLSFCENELTLTDGSDLVLLDTFKLWAEEIFGWYYFVTKTIYVPNRNGRGGKYEKRTIKKRLTTKQYLIVARGSAKSLYLACLQAYYLTVLSETTHQITTAPTMKQAEEVLSPIRTAIVRSRGPVFKFMTMGSLQNTTGPKSERTKLAPTKKGIECFITGSLLEIRPMTIAKLQGLRPKLSTVDEWLSADLIEDVVGALEQGASKMEDYLIVATSSEGTVRNGSGDSIKMELRKILEGKYKNPHVSIFWYKIDDIKEVNDPDSWAKACPSIGITVSYETYQLDVERAIAAPSTRNDMLAKRFGLPMEGYTYFFTYAETLTHPYSNYGGSVCSLGMDASQGNDFCSFVFLFPLRDGSFGIKSRSYITSLTLMKLPPAMRVKYDEFLDEDSLVILDSAIIDMLEVYDELISYIEKNDYSVVSFGYDPYNAEAILKKWEQEQSSYGIEKVRQGVMTESVPLGELKNLSEERLLKFDQSIMSFAMSNCMVAEDTNGNRKLYKRRYEAKIDPVSALLCSFVAFKLHKDEFE
jgi:phage terminase large subunit-like protein